jgi:hypothetical protein
MGEMTIGQIAEFIFDKGALGVLLVFIAALAVGRLIWRTQLDELVAVITSKNEVIIQNLKEHHKEIVEGLKQQLLDRDKQIERWMAVSSQQTRTVDKSLEAVKTATEKPAA